MIVLITWFATGSGGGERSTIELCNKLSASPQVKKVILLYGYSHPEARRLVDRRLNRSVQRYLPRIPLVLWRLVGFVWVFYICKTNRPSLVQVNIRATFTESLAAGICGCPVISCLRIMPFRRSQLWNYHFVDHMVCVSKAVKQRVRCLGWAKRATIIYNGVDVSAFVPSGRRLPGEANCFYTFGRLVDWKRHDLFVKAAAIVHQQDPSARFGIFGDGGMERSLRALINESHLSSIVRLMGAIEPTDESLDRFGIFVFPSYEEAFGRVLVEAVLKGKVVVASRAGAVPELIPDHKMLFPRDNAEALANKMLQASANFEKYRREVLEMRNRFASQFNLERVANDYLTLYGEVIARTRCSRPSATENYGFWTPQGYIRNIRRMANRCGLLFRVHPA